MDYRALKELVRRGEGHQLEFKLKSAHPEKIIREVVAFANSDGGLLLIGVGDDKSIPGLKYADEDEYLLCRAIDKHCFPHIQYAVDRVALPDEREVLVFSVPRSVGRPHYVVPDLNLPDDKKAYIRVADQSLQASREMREILKGERLARDVRFCYGEKEAALMHHLGQHDSITVEGFAAIANIPRKIASRTLVLLVLANVLRVQPGEMLDRYISRVV